MKIYISVDMEGIAGTNTWKQEATSDERATLRENISRQVKWVIEGIKESDMNQKITEIRIADSHGAGNNLSYDLTDLDERIYLISGSPRPQYMMSDFSDDISMVFLVGYHAGIGKTNGSMDHTFSSQCFHNLWINDKSMNEAMVNSAYAGYYNVPVTLVIGDEALKEELIETNEMPWIEFVSTKRALGRLAAKHYPSAMVRNNTIKAVKKVLNENFKVKKIYKVQGPINLKIEFTATTMADFASLMPNVKRLSGTTIEIIHKDYKKIMDIIIAVLYLAVHGIR